MELGTSSDFIYQSQNENEVQKIVEIEKSIESEVQESEFNQGKTLEDYQLTRDRVRRETREPTRFNDYISLAVLSYRDLALKNLTSMTGY